MNKFPTKFFQVPTSLLQSAVPPPATASTVAGVSSATKSFNSRINRLSLDGAHNEVLRTYVSMLHSDTATPDAFTYPSLIKACTLLKLFSLGISFHQRLVIDGFSSDPYISSSLITFYSRFGRTEIAHKVFDIMPVKNVVPWTAIIGCYSRDGDMNSAFFMHRSMQYEGIKPTSVTILALLSGVYDVFQVKCLHTCVVKHGFGYKLDLVNYMLTVYGRCGKLEDAKKLFESMDSKDIVSWNSLISSYVLSSNFVEMLRVLYEMRVAGVEPDQQTFTSVVSLMAKQGNNRLGKVVHGQILIRGFGSSIHIESSLMAMYLKYGNVNVAIRVFERATEKDAVSWTAMISGLVQNEVYDMAMELFQKMLTSGVSPSGTTMASVLAGSPHLSTHKLGHCIHGYMIRKRIENIPSQNALITMYAKCGQLQQSIHVFETMQERDVVSWNAIVAANIQNGNSSLAFSRFSEMRTSAARVRPDSITVVSLLQACSSMGTYQQGRWIHNIVIRSCLGPCIMIDTALVDMYSKCGSLNTARKCFDQMPYRDLVSWSTMIAGYGSHGEGEKALQMFSTFLDNGNKPNSVIFLTILYSCSHNGLVDEGVHLYESMERDFGVKPEQEHHGCIIDLLCRAGKVEDAYGLYKKLFPEPFLDALGIILDGCRAKGKNKLGDVVAEEMALLKPVDPGKYVQLANSYASMEKWDSVGKSLVQMRSLGLKKNPGWSFIELQDGIRTFFRGHVYHHDHDDHHSQIDENVMIILENLGKEIMEVVAVCTNEDDDDDF